ncbi:MAG: hypothetical protein ABSE42_11750 [Bryobacteraceae bacterium]
MKRKRELRSAAPIRLAFLALAATLASAAIIDRIAVSVGDRVITSSDIEREIRVTAFLNGQPPDLSTPSKRAAAERMVEQRLVRRELETSRYPVPQPAEIEPALAAFRHRYYPAEADYRRALAQYRISDQDVRDTLLWQRTLLQFVDVRFRPAVQITGEEIQKYFDTVLAPHLHAAEPGKTVSLDDYRDQIEDILAGQREDREMDTWLREARRQTPIVYHDEALQ